MSRVHHGQAKNIARLFILLTYVLSIFMWAAIPMVARPQNTVPTETVIVQNLRQPAEIQCSGGDFRLRSGSHF